MAKKKYNDDDGRTISNMNVAGMKGYIPEEQLENKKSLGKLKLSKKERRAIMKGTYMAYLPVFLTIILSFSLIFLLMWLWLKFAG